MVVQPSGSGPDIMLATITKSLGVFSFISGIQESVQVLRGCRERSSMLFIPISLPCSRNAPKRVRGSTVGSTVTVLRTAPPHPSLAARMTRLASSVGGAEESIKGLANGIPANSIAKGVSVIGAATSIHFSRGFFPDKAFRHMYIHYTICRCC